MPGRVNTTAYPTLSGCGSTITRCSPKTLRYHSSLTAMSVTVTPTWWYPAKVGSNPAAVSASAETVMVSTLPVPCAGMQMVPSV